MDFNLFYRMYMVCISSWRTLAFTGADEKTKDLQHFHNHCPACHITTRIDGNGRVNCLFCPIDKWRKMAENDPTFNPKRDAMCEEWNEPYRNWRVGMHTSEINNARQRLVNAKIISEMNWSYLEIYKTINW